MNVSKMERNLSSILRNRLENSTTDVRGHGLISTKLLSPLLRERIRWEQNSPASKLSYMSNSTFFQRYSVFLFLFLTFLISWGGSFLAVGPGGETTDLSDVGIMGFAMLAGPFITGMLMTYLTDGREGLGDPFFSNDEMACWWTLVYWI